MIFGRGRGGWRRRGRRGWGGRNVGRTGCPARSARGAHRRAEVGWTRQSCSGRGGGEGIDRVEEDKTAVVGGFGVVESGRLALALGLAGRLGVWSRPRSRLGERGTRRGDRRWARVEVGVYAIGRVCGGG